MDFNDPMSWNPSMRTDLYQNIMWGDVPFDEHIPTIYAVRILNVSDVELTKQDGHIRYYRYKAKFLFDYPELNLLKGEKVFLNFPINAFSISLADHPSSKRLVKLGDKRDWYMVFCRPTKKTMFIQHLELLPNTEDFSKGLIQ